jgi:hypothetical protein
MAFLVVEPLLDSVVDSFYVPIQGSNRLYPSVQNAAGSISTSKPIL